MEEQLAAPQRIVIVAIAVLVLAYVGIMQENLAIVNRCVAVLQVCPSSPQGLDFRTLKDNSRFDYLVNEVVVAGLAILSNHLDAVFHILTPTIQPLLRRRGLVRGLFDHLDYSG